MNNLVIGLMILAASLSIYGTASAALADNGSNYIYEKKLKITWLDHTGRSRYGDYIYDMSWQNAMEWASDLNEGGVSDWRLPYARNFDRSGLVTGSSRLNEMGHLIFGDLGNIPYGYLAKMSPFKGQSQGGLYWLDTHDAYSWDKDWTFDLTGTKQKIRYDNWRAYRLAMHDGDFRHHCPISAVPIPTTLLLLISGLSTIWLFLKQSWTKKVRS